MKQSILSRIIFAVFLLLMNLFFLFLAVHAPQRQDIQALASWVEYLAPNETLYQRTQAAYDILTLCGLPSVSPYPFLRRLSPASIQASQTALELYQEAEQ